MNTLFVSSFSIWVSSKLSCLVTATWNHDYLRFTLPSTLVITFWRVSSHSLPRNQYLFYFPLCLHQHQWAVVAFSICTLWTLSHWNVCMGSLYIFSITFLSLSTLNSFISTLYFIHPDDSYLPKQGVFLCVTVTLLNVYSCATNTLLFLDWRE